MDFINLYNHHKKKPFNCDILSKFKIRNIMFGSGGSDNIILDVRDADNNKFIVKLILDVLEPNQKIKPNHYQLEIKFYQFFTKKYVLTDRTPHIVGIYNHQHCSGVGKLLHNINPGKKTCPTIQDELIKKINIKYANKKICDMMLRYDLGILNASYDVIYLEHCETTLSTFIEWYMKEISMNSHANSIVSQFISDMYRILFQLIFTLAIIKEDYPGFMHGDFFVRNILLNMENKYHDDDYVAYHYKQRVFYLPANGQYAKINDFDMSIIINELEPNTYQMYQKFNQLHHINPFNPKSDIFNLLHDIYDGENLGTTSVIEHAHKLKIPIAYFRIIKSFLGRFINVDIIDRINLNNKELFDRTWHIDGIEILEKTVLTPDQYLLDDHFEIFQELPNDAQVIRHFNSPMNDEK